MAPSRPVARPRGESDLFKRTPTINRTSSNGSTFASIAEGTAHIISLFRHDHHAHDHGHTHTSHSHGAHTSHSEPGERSRLTEFLLSFTSPGWIMHSILSEQDSRRIFYFGSLNLAFMMIQFAYGLVTGSLGLLTDSIHMLFDCAGLVVGLAAAIVAKWPPSHRFPYGLGKVDSLSGFGNGIFLMLVSFEVLFEAVHRFRNGSKLRRLNELLVISVLGLLVNLVGLAVFGAEHHGHHHGHAHGHSHGPKHKDDHPAAKVEHKSSNGSLHGHSLQPSPLPSLPQSPLSAPPLTPANIDQTMDCAPQHAPRFDDHADESHAFDHSHHHHYHPQHHQHHRHDNNENMQGIFLHVLADTLGSVAVIVSTLLAQYTGWDGWDPLASIIVAAMIFASALPLTRACARKLMMVLGDEVEYLGRDCLYGVGGLRGVVGYHGVAFWVVEGSAKEEGTTGVGGAGKKVCGKMHVVAGRGQDGDDVRERVGMYLRGKGLDVLVQVEKEGTNIACGGCRGR